MPINPLQLPDPIRATPIDFTPLNKLGDAFVDYRKQQALADAINQYRNPDGSIDAAKAGAAVMGTGNIAAGVPLANLGATIEQRKIQQANADRQFAESVREHNQSYGLQGAQLAETRRLNDRTVNMPVKVGEDPYTGQVSYATFKNGRFEPISVPGAPGSPLPIPGTPPQASAAAPDQVGSPSVAAPSVAATENIDPEEKRKADFLASRPSYVSPIIKGIASYDMDPRTILARFPAAGRMRIMSDVAEYRPDYNQQNYPASQAAYTKFTSGAPATAIKSFNVGLEHIDQLVDLGKALNNGDMRFYNSIKNKFHAEFGADAPTNFEGLKAIVGAEIVKAIVGAGGTGEERAAAARTVSDASSMPQLLGIANTYKQAMGAQLGGLKRQYETSTFRNDFTKFLSPTAQKAYAEHEKAAAAPDQQGAAPAGKPALGSVKIPMQAAADLKNSPTPEMRQHFDDVFGAGAADRVLGRRQ